VPDRRLVLASASPARLRVLREAGFAPDVVVSGVDEDLGSLGDAARCTETAVAELARRKAVAVAARLDGGAPGSLVLGCDSMLDLDGDPHGKPPSVAEARERWQRMRGREGVLCTGHCLVDTRTGRVAAEVVSTVVRFGRPTDAELEAYLASGEPLAVAGAFTLDGRSAAFVDGVEGDPLSVVGVSPAAVRRLLAEHGVAVAEVWS
jgi:septum formation protein